MPEKGVTSRILASIADLSWYGAACTILAALIYWNEQDSIARDGGLSLGRLVAVYVAITILSGVILGVLRPLAKGTLSTSLVSIPVALPAALAAVWFAEGRQVSRVSTTDVIIALCLATIAGPLIVAYDSARKQSGRRNG
jgi:hypothetical protein